MTALLSLFLRSLLPAPVRNCIRSNAVVRWLKSQNISQMEVGLGRGLTFDPGPSNRSYASGDNELPIQEALAARMKAGDVFYDIGANVGFFSVLGARLVGTSGFVYAFEPVPENATYVRRNLDLNKFTHCEVIEQAVSARSGSEQLWVAEYSGGAALATAARPPDAKTRIDVDVVSIDDFVFEQHARPPAVVKIDVEGAEIAVLRGMSRVLREVRPVVIYEIDDEQIGAFTAKYRVCEAFLRELDYSVERLRPAYPGNPWIVGHALAIPQ